MSQYSQSQWPGYQAGAGMGAGAGNQQGQGNAPMNGMGMQQPMAQGQWPQQPGQYASNATSSLTSTLTSDRFIKGMLIGAAATYLLTNEQVQRTAIKGVVRAWSMIQGGVEEVKERFGDAEAELRHANQRQDP